MIELPMIVITRDAEKREALDADVSPHSLLPVDVTGEMLVDGVNREIVMLDQMLNGEMNLAISKDAAAALELARLAQPIGHAHAKSRRVLFERVCGNIDARTCDRRKAGISIGIGGIVVVNGKRRKDRKLVARSRSQGGDAIRRLLNRQRRHVAGIIDVYGRIEILFNLDAAADVGDSVDGIPPGFVGPRCAIAAGRMTPRRRVRSIDRIGKIECRTFGMEVSGVD